MLLSGPGLTHVESMCPTVPVRGMLFPDIPLSADCMAGPAKQVQVLGTVDR